MKPSEYLLSWSWSLVQILALVLISDVSGGWTTAREKNNEDDGSWQHAQQGNGQSVCLSVCLSVSHWNY